MTVLKAVLSGFSQNEIRGTDLCTGSFAGVDRGESAIINFILIICNLHKLLGPVLI